jgi:hypothetical protein
MKNGNCDDERCPVFCVVCVVCGFFGSCSGVLVLRFLFLGSCSWVLPEYIIDSRNHGRLLCFINNN